MEPIPFAGSELGAYRHVCAFFSSQQEEDATLLPFVRDGLERGERAYHVLDARYRQQHLDQLRGAGIDVRAAQQRRQLEVVTPEEVYLRNGRVSKEPMLEVLEEVLKAGPTLGFPLTRLIARSEALEAMLQDGSVANEWIEYEARLNDVLPHYHDPVICTYHANLLNGAIAVDLLRTHPVAIIGGRLYENPFFVPATKFLAEIAARNETSPEPYRSPT
jgi:hypothetical protein